jgi:hypothetical protein
MDIVKSTDLWRNPKITDLRGSFLSNIQCGLIIASEYDEKIDEYVYFVELKKGAQFTVGRARQIYDVGDVYNFTEYRLRTNHATNDKRHQVRLGGFSKVVGELVVVAAIDGSYYNLVILGSLKNHARNTAEERKSEDMFSYSIYNGIETEINKDGEYKLTFKGKPINEDKLLKHEDGAEIEPPEYDEEIGGSSFKMEKDGSISFSDAHKEILQIFKIDKTANEFSFASKETKFKISGKDDLVSFTSKDYKIEAKDSFKVETKDVELKGSGSIKINSQKVAIGSSGVELLDQIVSLVDALANLIINSPTGPCTPFNTAPTWAQVEAIKSKINSIKGSI